MATLPRFDAFARELVSEREYLSTAYEPDCDYVDGRVEERNLGEFDHAMLQGLISNLFLNHRRDWGAHPVPELRIQVKSMRYRVPDVTVIRSGTPREQILTRPPLLVIEILSPEDRRNRVIQRNQDYLDFGIEHVWVIDPGTRTGYRSITGGLEPVEGGEFTIPGTPIRLRLSELFAEFDSL
jgi:Uma2 family endonuclease